MTMTVGYAAKSARAPLERFSFERRELGANDVAIAIQFCGICHSDLHQVNNDWGGSIYPIVPGHEIIGKVTAVGSGVSTFSKGDVVGVGCLVDSCGHCSRCEQGEEQFCENGGTQTYNSEDKVSGGVTYGGYSKHIVVNQDFVLKVDKGLDSAAVAPLLCAGITTYSPLKEANVTKGSKVGVVGLGGLGHMAVKIAKAMGAQVTVFTTSQNKVDAAKALGATDVILSTDPNAINAVANQYDFILDTVSARHDMNIYLNALKIDGKFTQVGLPAEPMEMSMFPMILKHLSVSGSLIGGIKKTQEMLDFCAKHHIVADIELIKITDINEAYKRLQKGDVKYRFVIDMNSLQ